MRKKVLLAGLLLALSITAGYAHETPLAVYDLKLFDYQLGMTYDEASSTRAFHYLATPTENRAIGIINSAYIEDVEINLSVYFLDGRVFKIIGKFNPKELEKVAQSLEKALGAGEENTKTINKPDGALVTQRLYQWSFPGAKIYLIGLSNNTEYATLSMMDSASAARETQP